MALQFAVGNTTTGATALVAEGGATGLLEIRDGDVISFVARGGNANKLMDLQRSADATTWNTWQSVRANAAGDADFLALTEPTPAPATEYYRVVSRTV